MKAKTFKALLTGIILLCSITSIYAQEPVRNWYWRVEPQNSNFNSPGNWTTSETGVGGSVPSNAPPTLADTLHFIHESDYKALWVSGNAEMATLNVTVSGYSFTENTTYRISGDINVVDDFTITRGNVDMVNNSGAVDRDVVINLGGSSETGFGGEFRIDKPGQKVTLVSSMNIPETAIRLFNGSFDSNENDINAVFFRESGSSVGITRKYSGSKIVLRDDLTLNRYNATHEFSNSKITAATVSINQSFSDAQNQSERVALELSDVTIIEWRNNEGRPANTRSTLELGGENVGLKIKDLKINAPMFRLSGRSNDIDVDNFIIQEQGFLRFENVKMNINNISENFTAGCGENSVFYGTGNYGSGNNDVIIFKATGSAINTSKITYKNIDFSNDGEQWFAPKQNNGGLNTGNIDWTGNYEGRDFYWRGNTKEDWYDGTRWRVNGSVANCVPSIMDDVYINNDSFSADGQTIVLSRPGFCKNIYWQNSDNEKGFLVLFDNVNLNDNSVGNDESVSLTISGNADFSGVKEWGIHPDLHFIGTGTITSLAQGVTYRSRAIHFNTTGGYSLVNDFLSLRGHAIERGSDIYHYSGELISNGYTVDGNFFHSRPDRYNSSRILNLENSKIIARNDGAELIWLERDGGALTYNFNGSHFHIISRFWGQFRAEDSKNNHYWEFDKITFENAVLSNNGRVQLVFNENQNTIKELTIKDFNFESSNGFSVETLNITPNRVYEFADNENDKKTFITKKVNVVGGECDMLTLTSRHSSRPAVLKGEYSPFEIRGANISNIHAEGEQLVVAGGLDEGNNNNVHIVERDPRIFYWVGGSGDWSDGGNWSTEEPGGSGGSGGDPALTNPSKCIPSKNDIVYFDEHSFDSKGQSVYVDVSAITIHSMIWTAGVNDFEPRFRRKDSGASTLFTLYGSLELAEKMILGENSSNHGSPIGEVLFMGNEIAPYSQFIKTYGANSVDMKYLGEGRFDLLSDVRGSVVIEDLNSSFYTNDYNVLSGGYFTGRSKNLYLGESYIRADRVVIGPNSGGIVDTEHSTLSGWNVTINTDNLYFRTIEYEGFHSRNNDGTFNVVYADSVVARRVNSTYLNATIVTNTLVTNGGHFTVREGLTVTVNDSISAYGASPCNYSNFRAVVDGNDAANPTSKVTIQKGNCDDGKDLVIGTFFNLYNIIGGQAGSCSGINYILYGRTDGGNTNENIEFRAAIEASEESSILDPITITCNETYMFSPVVGAPVFCIWDKWNGSAWVEVEGFRNDNALPVTMPGRYRVVAHYDNSNGCTLVYEQEVDFHDAPDLEIDESASGITKSGDDRTVNIYFDNIGEVSTGSPVYITLYKDSISLESILESGSIAGPITVGGPGSRGRYTFTFEYSDTITNVIARVNDRGGNFPYEPECLYDNNTITLANEASDARGYYVTVSGNGDKSGYDWENAMSDARFHRRLFLSVSGDVYHVAEGVYYPLSAANDPSGGGGLWDEEPLLNPENPPTSKPTFMLKEGVSIIGSYKPGLTGTDNDLINDRNHIITATGELVPTTIFSGDLNENGVLDNKDATVLMHADNVNAGDTVYLNGIEMTHAYRGGLYSINTNIDMEYCKVTNIRFEGPGNTANYTNGVLAFNGGSLNIRKSAITDNKGENNGLASSGNGWGTIRMGKADFSIYNSVISNNSVGRYTASAIYFMGNKSLKIYNSTISDNTTMCEKSGAVYIVDDVATVDIINSTIVGNKSTHASPIGAGIALESRFNGDHRGPKPFNLDNTIVSGNDVHNITLLSAEQSGGGGGLWDEEPLLDPENKHANYKDGYLFDQNVFLQGQNSHHQHFIAKYSIIDKYFVNGSVSATDVNFSAGTHLGSLAHNGGATKTRALLETSTPLNYAINGGNPLYVGTGTALDGLNMDQREELRSSMPSIGAYEFKAAPLQVEKKAELLGVKSKGAYANPVSVLGNEKIKYTITAVNLTPMNDNLTIIDTLPAYMTFVDDGTAIPAPATSETSAPHDNPKREVLRWSFPIAAMGSDSVSFYAQPRPGSAASQPLFINNAWVTLGSLPWIQTNNTYHQGAGISIATFSAGFGGNIFNATEQALDYMSTPSSGIVIVPEDGYEFAGWSHNGYTSLRGVVVEAQEGIMHYDTLLVYGNVELRAVFAPVEESLDEDEDVEPKSIETEDKAWAVKDELFITTVNAGSIVRVYSTEGVLREQHTIVSAGTTSRKLSRGIYMVTINNNIGHKVRVE